MPLCGVVTTATSANVSRTMKDKQPYSFGYNCHGHRPSRKGSLLGSGSGHHIHHRPGTVTSTCSITASSKGCGSTNITDNNSRDENLNVLLYIYRNVTQKLKGRRKDKDSPTPPGGEEQLKAYLQEENLKARVSDADFFKLVALPPHLDLNEWLATHTISFFHHVNLLYGVVSEYCTAEVCPNMSAPDNVQYFWYDDKGKKSKHTAPQYIDSVMAHIQKLINDEAVFPTKFDQSFPADLESVIQKIHKYLFQVLAHLYHAHYSLLLHLGLHAHLNTVFTHLMVFTSKFDLVPDRDTDLLLPLFSLLLKSLADPAQNPTLREGLGIGEHELSLFAADNSGRGRHSSEKSVGQQEGMEEAESCPAGAKDLTSSTSSSPSHTSRGHDSGMGDDDSISVTTTASAAGMAVPSTTSDSCSIASNISSSLSTSAGNATDQSGFLSSSFPPPNHHHQSHLPLLSSSPASQRRVGNGAGGMGLHHPFSCDGRSVPPQPGHVVDCSTGLPSGIFPHSSSPPHRSGLVEVNATTQQVVDVDPTKPPSEWLSSMQVSAT